MAVKTVCVCVFVIIGRWSVLLAVQVQLFWLTLNNTPDYKANRLMDY